MDYHPGWLLVIAGFVVVTIGLVWLLAPSVPWFGRLPGDIVIERGRGRFYFPVTTCIIVSLLLSGLLWLVRRLAGSQGTVPIFAAQRTSRRQLAFPPQRGRGQVHFSADGFQAWHVFPPKNGPVPGLWLRLVRRLTG